ncbi:Bax inhibitor-1/YccA family protein [Acetobacter indonesiensis]|jgi:FtsH-binding integral membrane protein|uniref:ABC transporter permease n=1 Tax=Acetobacter indonesiensis TaxID=104101 RepID=A0A252ATX4_9PROT|nr:Bax inhibitor-1/YccA family protein [Acetobacter indonesiensis]MCG0994987.1 Bax inhibitor-1/YccA family protein [Acetobacter indonesiensis]MCI1437390.1 Bax inhibitor-1/YccA family protein [Acetobacter indonesiensis]MCI1546443.1 Bax inhibitor-1/YccA family protein [Acetobacter indonesiensis]MCI1765014.1 Bax inhibitor-1/YccA family protein [Acetobacter indonesiensis]MCP1230216.1 Bax inhibitor-1/YccA family protein [Acetobacter indonesiensis]
MSFGQDFRSPAAASGWNAQAGALDAGLRAYMLRVYNWMASGLLLTGIVAYAVASTSLRGLFFQLTPTPGGMALHPTLLGGAAMIAPLAFVLVMSFGVNRLSRQGAQALFWAFCATMGASLSSIFLVYTGVSVVRVFLVTACMFGATSLWGYTTKANLAKFGSFLMMGLFGLVIAGLVNIFLKSPAVYFIYSIVGVFIFTAFSAFDAQRIRVTYPQYAAYEGPDGAAKRSVYDALSLYLNFINLFQFLLQFMGVRSSND